MPLSTFQLLQLLIKSHSLTHPKIVRKFTTPLAADFPVDTLHFQLLHIFSYSSIGKALRFAIFSDNRDLRLLANEPGFAVWLLVCTCAQANKIHILCSYGHAFIHNFERLLTSQSRRNTIDKAYYLLESAQLPSELSYTPGRRDLPSFLLQR